MSWNKKHLTLVFILDGGILELCKRKKNIDGLLWAELDGAKDFCQIGRIGWYLIKKAIVGS